MQLFPETLFSAYLPPVLLMLVLMLAAGAGLILVLVKKHKENGGQKK